MNFRKVALIGLIGLITSLPALAGQNIGTYTLNPGGSQEFTNVTAADIIKASGGTLRMLSVIAPGTTSGAWTFYDVNNTPAAYSGTTQYVVGNGVTSGGNTFVAISTPPLATATTNATYWKQIGALVSIPYNATVNVAGALIAVNIVFNYGISLTAVPGAGTPQLAGAFQ